MEIRNNTPSFGMAFRRPSADKMQSFIDYVGAGVSGKDAKKALTVLQKQQDGNKDCDIEYLDDGNFGLVPKTDKAKELYGSEVITILKDKKVTTATDNIMRQVQVLKQEQNGKLTKFQKLKYAVKILVATVKDATNPLRVLPENLQHTAKMATDIDSTTNAQIAKDNTIKSAFPV